MHLMLVDHLIKAKKCYEILKITEDWRYFLSKRIKWIKVYFQDDVVDWDF